METEISKKKKLFLLDAYALIYRSYFAFIKNPRYNSKGVNTSSIFGFVNTLEQVLNTESPSHIAVVFDVHGETFRNKMYPEYKANREAMPEDIRTSIPYIRNIIEAYNIPILEMEGFEADDLLVLLLRKHQKRVL
jgi:DNA polymerase-1